MNAIAILFFVGVILLASEVFVPGGVLGIIGGLAMAAGCGSGAREASQAAAVRSGHTTPEPSSRPWFNYGQQALYHI